MPNTFISCDHFCLIDIICKMRCFLMCTFSMLQIRLFVVADFQISCRIQTITMDLIFLSGGVRLRLKSLSWHKPKPSFLIHKTILFKLCKYNLCCNAYWYVVENDYYFLIKQSRLFMLNICYKFDYSQRQYKKFFGRNFVNA